MVKTKQCVGRGCEHLKWYLAVKSVWGEANNHVSYTSSLISVMCRVPLRFSKPQKKADWTEMKKKLISCIWNMWLFIISLKRDLILSSNRYKGLLTFSALVKVPEVQKVTLTHIKGLHWYYINCLTYTEISPSYFWQVFFLIAFTVCFYHLHIRCINRCVNIFYGKLILSFPFQHLLRQH